MRKGAPDIPVWLFSTAHPSPETARLCQTVVVHPASIILLLQAEAILWRQWVALSIGTWTGGYRRLLVKIAPFLIPPFRVLILNAHGDFFAGTPYHIGRHVIRLVLDRLNDVWNITRAGAIITARYIRDTAHWFGAAALLARLVLWSAFRNLLGAEPIQVASPGAGVALFRQSGKQWNHRGLEDFTAASDSRFILWQDGSIGDGSAADLIPLFNDPRTFAVSRQSCFRAWQPLILPAAPFRRLQPGEASQVLAPLSGTILVDRCKLLALGIPHARYPETAWIWIFWKAAMNGWRCFSVGQQEAVPEQPGRHYPRLGFLVGLLSGPLLRRFGPEEATLARGCVAFMPSAGWNESGTNRI